MRAEELRAYNEEELASAIEEAREELFNLRFQHATGRLADTSRLTVVRRDLARLLTVVRERELWAEYEAESGEEE